MRCSCCNSKLLVGANFCGHCGTKIVKDDYIEIPDVTNCSNDFDERFDGENNTAVIDSRSVDSDYYMKKIHTVSVIAENASDLWDDREICDEEVSSRELSSVLMGAASLGSALLMDSDDDFCPSLFSGAVGAINGAKVIKHRGSSSKLAIIGTTLSVAGIILGLAMKYLK